MERLLSGTKYDVGPEQMNAAFNTLQNPNASIELNGTLGPPTDFNRDGTRNSKGSVWCVDDTRTLRFDVLRYSVNEEDATSAALTGDFPAECIPDF
jgi:hypothetical protein